MNIQLTDRIADLKATKTAPVWVSKKTSRAWACGAEMAELRAAGASIQKLSEQFGVSWPTVRKIIAANAPYTTDRPGLDKDSHRLELQNMAMQGELKIERKRSQKARDAFRDARDKAKMARESYKGLAERSAANLENLQAELTEAKAWGNKWKAEHADIVKRLVAEQSCLADQKQMTKSAREAYEGAKKSVANLSDKAGELRQDLTNTRQRLTDKNAEIVELHTATHDLKQKLDHAETEVTNARLAEQAAHDRLNDPSWANRWSKEAHDEFEKRKQAELDLMAAEAQLERMAEKLAECRNRGFFARVFG